jgi:hypothetical protein
MKIAAFFAVVLTALALAPGLAHLFALPNKIGLPQEQYFVAQGIYRGWALLGIVLFAALAANFVLALISRGKGAAFVFAGAGFLLILVTLGIFFRWTYPANVATENWTSVPANWEGLRRQWEYSHAVNALITFAALCCVTTSALVARD